MDIKKATVCEWIETCRVSICCGCRFRPLCDTDGPYYHGSTPGSWTVTDARNMTLGELIEHCRFQGPDTCGLCRHRDVCEDIETPPMFWKLPGGDLNASA